MATARRFTITALREIPELSLHAGDTVIVDRRHPIAPVTFNGRPLMEPAYLCVLSHTVFLSRPCKADKDPTPLTVTPSYVGAQWTLENLHAEARGWRTSAAARAAERHQLRAAVTAALATPLESAPREAHASAILGTAGFHRLTQSLAHLRALAGGAHVDPS